jgi:hypothetical protein
VRRAPFALVCCVAAALELFFAIPGCLNPRPEELPSSGNDDGQSGPVVPLTPQRETCEDNRLLAGCADSLPDEDINGDPIAIQNPPAATVPAPVTPSPPNFGGGGDAGADAGVPSDDPDAAP